MKLRVGVAAIFLGLWVVGRGYGATIDEILPHLENTVLKSPGFADVECWRKVSDSRMAEKRPFYDRIHCMEYVNGAKYQFTTFQSKRSAEEQTSDVDPASGQVMLFDGVAVYQFGTPHPYELMVDRNPERFRLTLIVGTPDSVLRGYWCAGVDVGQVLRESKVVVTDQDETIGGVASTKVEATGKYGRYTLWLHPEDFTLLKGHVEASGDDLYFGKPLSVRPPGATPKNTRVHCSYDVGHVVYQRVKDVELPMSCEWSSESRYESGDVSRIEGRINRLGVEMSPSVEWEKVLRVDVPEGTRAVVIGEQGGGPMVWREGKLVKDDDQRRQRVGP